KTTLSVIFLLTLFKILSASAKTIDFDKKRIVTTMAVHRDFNWKKIAHSVIKKGKVIGLTTFPSSL
ncbi:MAG: hypothetical protein QF358_13030, partial [Arenicellales bacterium]|nr:hypothetical protein [Arenicellales bacterium]